MSFLLGTPGKFEQISTLNKRQRPIENQLYASAQGPGGGGAFGTAGDYYRSLLSDDNSTFNAFAAPEMRQFREDIIPSLSEQFAGMGSGGLSSSGFRNAAVSAGTDLSERLGAIRAQLRQQGAQGLMGLGQQALQPFQENVYRPPQEGFLQALAPALGTAAGVLGGNWLSAASGLGSSLKGKTLPYGGSAQGETTNLRSPTTMFRGA